MGVASRTKWERRVRRNSHPIERQRPKFRKVAVLFMKAVRMEAAERRAQILRLRADRAHELEQRADRRLHARRERRRRAARRLAHG